MSVFGNLPMKNAWSRSRVHYPLQFPHFLDETFLGKTSNTLLIDVNSITVLVSTQFVLDFDIFIDFDRCQKPWNYFYTEYNENQHFSHQNKTSLSHEEEILHCSKEMAISNTPVACLIRIAWCITIMSPFVRIEK